MIDPAWFLDQLRGLGISFFTGVPDSLLKALNAQILADLPTDRHVIAANEGAATGIAIGHYLRTGEPAAVYLQNSGFGNLVNPLLSLADPDVYGVPMLVIVGWRGQPGVPDEPQHVKQGRIMEPLLDALDLPWQVLPADPADAGRCVAEAVRTATERGTPYLLLVRKDTFHPYRAGPSGEDRAGPSRDDHEQIAGNAGRVGRSAHDRPDGGRLPSREEALLALVAAVGEEAVIVSTTGMLSRELFEYRARSGRDPGRDFLTVGGMGHACSIALGVAMREAAREVWCFDGDGALLMHLGSLAVIADQRPPRLFHVVFNNGVHDSVGGQPTVICAMDVPAVAMAAGYRYATAADDPAKVPAAVARLREHGGPSLLELRVRPGNRSDLGRPSRTPAESRRAFMAALADG